MVLRAIHDLALVTMHQIIFHLSTNAPHIVGPQKKNLCMSVCALNG